MNTPEMQEWLKKGPHLCPDGQPTLGESLMGAFFEPIIGSLAQIAGDKVQNGASLDDPEVTDLFDAVESYGSIPNSYRSCITTQVR
jgi:hypothetical protein